MPLSTIKTSLYTQLEGVSLPSGVVIFYPNTDTSLPTSDFIRPDVLPGATDPLDLSHTNQENGILQVSVFVQKGKGEIRTADIVDAILDGFPRGLSLTGVRIDRPGYAGPSFFDGSWQVTPVTVPYQNIE